MNILEEKLVEDIVIDDSNLIIDQSIFLNLLILSKYSSFPLRDTLKQKNIQAKFMQSIKTLGLSFSRERNLVNDSDKIVDCDNNKY